jgi:predicted metal-dependent phosphotriesterase family hydrolase
MNRRSFISLAILAGAGAFLPKPAFAAVRNFSRGRSELTGYIMTVRGKLKTNEAGNFLPHEHTLTDFTGAEKVKQPQYDRKMAFDFLLPHLQKLKATGIDTLVECTPAYIGRDVLLLRQLSEASGIHILTNTGYYAAVDFKYLPAHAYTESSAQLSDRWLGEWRNGIDGTGIRPGFMKLGVGSAPLKAMEKKLILAAALAHLKSGLKIAIHTGDGAAAAEELELLETAGVNADAMIWVHAQNDGAGKYHIDLAKKGCWISLDGFNGSTESVAKYTGYLKAFKTAGLLHKVLISHDDGFAVVKKGDAVGFEQFQNGNKNPYDAVQGILKPALISGGFNETELMQITRNNPGSAFRIEIRKNNRK